MIKRYKADFGFYYKNKCEYHTDHKDKPSYIHFNGTTYYKKNDNFNRNKKPDIIGSNGSLEFYENSKYIKRINEFGKIWK